MHEEASPLAEQVLVISTGSFQGQEFRVEDYWDRVSGSSWADSLGNPAAINYAIRASNIGLPFDDEVLYGKIGCLGYLVHVSEL